MKLPAYQFYPGDWMKDPALRSVSLAARGLWIDMLCLMFESSRRGYLQQANGQPLSLAQIARMTGCATDEAAHLVQELDDAGVCSRTEHGTIFSRRLVRDENTRKLTRERVSKYREQHSNAHVTQSVTQVKHASSSSSSISVQSAAMDASIAGRVLGERVGNTNVRFQEQSSRQIAAEAAKRNITIEATVDLMVAQWELYNTSRPRLNYPVSSAQKFFESGTWHDSKLWPWKAGYEPKEAGKRVYANAS